MRNTIGFLYIVLSFTLITACSQKAPTSETSMDRYYREHRFSIKFPDGWTTHIIKQQSGASYLEAVGPIDNLDRSKLSILIVRMVARDIEDLNRGAEIFMEIFGGESGQKINNQSNTVLDGHPAKQYLIDFDQQGIPIKILLVLIKRDDYLYYLGCSALAEKMKQLQGRCEDIFQTFRYRNSPLWKRVLQKIFE